MLVGIHGKAGAGKDTFAEYLQDYGFTMMAFADPVKRLAKQMFGFSNHELWGPSDLRETYIPKYNTTIRDILQKLGTDFGRSVYENIWIDKVFKDIELLNSTSSVYSREFGVILDPVYSDTDLKEIHEGLLKPCNNNSRVVLTDCRFLNEFFNLKAKDAYMIKIVKDDEKKLDHVSETQMDILDDNLYDIVINNSNTLDLSGVTGRIINELGV